MFDPKDVTVREYLRAAATYLGERRIIEPRLDAEVLLAHVMRVDRLRLYLEPDKALTAAELVAFQKLIGERGAGRPVAYLIGQKEFMSLNFRVGPGVLVPRPETELLVEEALRLNPRVVIDVGTGSGAIAVSIACLLPEVKVYAIDVSAEALSYARQNAAELGVAGKISFLQGDLLRALSGLRVQADCITANLPYIPTGDLDSLPLDVRAYEPHQALFGGADGLDLYRALIPQAVEFLSPGGTLIMEIGPGQGAVLKEELARDKAFTRTEVKDDYAGLERIMLTEFRGDRNGEPISGI